MSDLNDCYRAQNRLQGKLDDARQELITQDFIISELKSLLTYYTPPDCQREMEGAVSKMEHESRSRA